MNYTKTEDVFIRTVNYLNDKDAALVGMFLSYKDKEVPVYYEYCQKKHPEKILPVFNKIGYATNFHILNETMVCDVYLNKTNILSYHFSGTIDNFTTRLHNNKSELEFNLERLTIYNKRFKEHRDKEILEKTKEGTTNE